MTQEHPTKLSFSIEESVWLNKGQEVQEIVGMSLEPDITIEEKDHHVYIKGGLRLVGEYQSAVREAGIDLEDGSIEEQFSFRSVGDVSLSEDGKGQIKHFFPIDVTIPISRIQNLDDVYVQIESFDYDLPEKSCIQLTADISISGMNQPQETTNRVSEEANQEQETSDTAFSFDAKKVPVENQEPEAPEEKAYEVPSMNAWQPPAFNQFYGFQQPLPEQVEPEEEQIQEQEEVDTDVVAQYEEETEEPVFEEVERASKEDPVFEEVERSVNEEVEIEEVEEDVLEETEEPIYEEDAEEVEVEIEVEANEVRTEPEEERSVAPLMKMAARPSEDVAQREEVVEEQIEEEEQADYVQRPREENALYLTKMLTKGEERFSKWRMCIIQSDETIDTIARRYNVSTSQLARMNQLQEEKVEEGQILYIPASTKS
ncbi:stage VI sporulation protein D [Bacillus sp. FJAT-45037]|uniref:stage VI sporulation protein D n=1 Tax=Bacillus sp. FJAT-45037 TaxID=2011007 RepID=UPI000C238EE4|nr:stage VI sporulation protein D [Bacillus sp. FJAT-45037]